MVLPAIPAKKLASPQKLSLLLALSLFAHVGCRSDAHTDLYVNQMAAEIRVLEDQLYEADHENKLLRDELARAQGGSPGSTSKPTPSPSRLTTPSKTAPSLPRSNSPSLEPRSTSPSTAPSLEPRNSPPAIGPLDAPATSPGTLSPGPKDIPPETPPARLSPPPNNNDILPGEVQPPKIDLGKRILPPSESEAPSNGEDKIRLPKPVQELLSEPTGPPEEIQLDPAQTRAFTEDGRSGLDVVLTAFDRDGNLTPIGSEMEIVVMDPTLPVNEGRLAKWQVTSDQVRQATSTGRVTHLRLFWPPSTQADSRSPTPPNRPVKVYVRMRQGDQKGPVTDALVNLKGDPSGSDWLPRTARGDVEQRK